MNPDGETLFDYAKRVQFPTMTEKDATELKAGVREVLALMKDGQWHDAEKIIKVSGVRDGLRRMRELRAKGYVVEKKRLDRETRNWHYRLTYDVFNP